MKNRLTVPVIAVLLSLVITACQRRPAQQDFSALPVEEQLTQIKSNLDIHKKALAQRDEYQCCNLPTCNWCALIDKHCGCAPNLKADKPVCPECFRGWKMGTGAIPNIDTAKVKTMLPGVMVP